MNTIDDTALNEFLEQRQLKPSTVDNYIKNLTRYSEYHGLTLTQLLEEAEADEDSGVRMRKRRIKDRLKGYHKELINRELSPLTIKHAMTIVKTFYHEFEIELPTVRVSTKNIERQGAEEIPTLKHIRKAVENSNPKYQAMILLMATSGMGSAEIRELKIQDFFKAVDLPLEYVIHEPLLETIKKVSKNTIPVWHIRRVKTNMPYFTFSTPESTQAILRHLELSPPDNINQYLFPSNHGNKMGGHGLSKYFLRLNNRCGFPLDDRGQAFFHSHALRKFFATTLTRGNLPQLKIDWMLGHRIDPTTEAYFKPTIEGLKRDYLSIVPNLSFMEDARVRIITDERLRELEEDRKRDQKRIDELEEIIKRRLQIEQVPPTE